MTIDLAAFITPQGEKSTTFTRPPFDQSLTIPEIYAFHVLNSPKHPLFIYADDSTGTSHKICYPEAYAAIQKAHKLITCKHALLVQDSVGHPVIGVLANIDGITYFTFIIGIMHAGLTPFPISTGDSIVGLAHLIRTTNLRLLFVSPDAAIQRKALDACVILKAEGIIVHILPAPQFETLYNQDTSFMQLAPVRSSSDPEILILHSSGSTSYPKPIRLLNSKFVKYGLYPYYGEIDMGGMGIAAHSLPIFHTMGAMWIACAVCAGTVIGCFKPASPPIVPTPDAFLRGIIATRCEIVYCIPTFIEEWSRSPGNIPILRDLKALISVGAPTPAIGDQLVSAGVNLNRAHGMTETGVMGTFCTKSTSLDEWNYFKMASYLTFKMVPKGENQDGKIVEPIIIWTDSFSPHVINTTFQGKPAFATNDLLLRHPTKEDLYTFYGRVDDQLTLSTGEKTNPVPLEAMFRENKDITSAIMFGCDRFQHGVLVQPRLPFRADDKQKLIAFRNSIWTTVEKVNKHAPAHSRIFKEMIIVTDPKKPFEFTPRGTLRRQTCLKAYETEIDALYEALEETSQADLTIPDPWTAQSSMEFVRAAVTKVIKHPLATNQDFFQQGCDSLQATWIRNSLLRAIRSSKNNADVHCIPLTFVHTHPTIQVLGGYFWSLLAGTADVIQQDRIESARPEAKCLQIQSPVTKYTADIPSPAWKSPSTSSRNETTFL